MKDEVVRTAVRLAVLEMLEASAPHCLPLDTIARGLARAGYRLIDQEVLREVLSLEELSHISRGTHPLNPAESAWRLTERGRVALASQF